MRSFLGGAW